MCAPNFNTPFGKWEKYQPNIEPKKPEVRRGRKPKYDWEAGRLHIKDLFEYHGPLLSGDDDWSCQADIERALQEFFFKLMGQSPATSTVRKYAKMYMNEFMVNNSEN